MKVSLLVANYNNSPYLNDFFQSVINSKFDDLEVVIVDDGSKDKSVLIIEEIIRTNPKLKVNLIQLDRNHGFANALNIGMRECKGEYIARIDPDDKLHPERLTRQVFFLENNKDIDVVGTNVIIFNKDKEILKSNMFHDHDWIVKKYRRGEHGVLHGTVMIRSDVFKEFSYKQENVPAEDYDIFSRMIIHGCNFANIVEPLTYYRIHESSVSNYLPFSTVEKTFLLCEQIFGISNNRFKIMLSYISRRNYRRYLFTGSFISLIVSAVCNPDAIIRRLKNFLNFHVV
ncbi:TPA: glycosyltransferase family 2 protein [Vibrio cholerae]